MEDIGSSPDFGPNQVAVIDPYGNLGVIDASEAADALKNGGFRMPTGQELQDFQSKQTYGDGLGNTAKAFGAGALRSASFGVSDQALTKSGMVNPETLAGLEKHHPLATGAGEVAGIAGMFLAPEVGVASAVDGAVAKGATEGASLLSKLANPVKAASEFGQGVTESVAPLASDAASLIANPETSPVIHKMLSQAGAHAMGSAVEGAAYGLGQSVSEEALGDPGLNAEKVLSNVGYSALFAGTLGGLLGGAEGALKGARGTSAVAGEPVVTPVQALQEVGLKPDAPLTDLEVMSRYGAPGTPAGASGFRESVGLTDLEKEAQDGIIGGLSRLKPNADEIRNAAQQIGAPLPEGMISDSEHIQRIEHMLVTNPSPTGVQRKNLYDQGYYKASDVMARTMGDVEDQSLAQIGTKLKEQFTDAFEAKAGPIKELYGAIDEYSKAVPISDRSTGAVARNIRGIAKEHSLIKGTPEYNFVETFADGLDQVENLAQLKNFRTALSRASNKETRFVSGLIKEKLDNIEQNAIRRFADTMKRPEAKQKILGLLDQIDEAKSSYRVLREDMGKFSKTALGKEKVYGPQDFLDNIEEMTPEKFAKRLFSKDNSEFLQWLKKEFPQQTDMLANYQRAEIKAAAVKNGVFEPKAAIKAIDKLSPEVQRILFTPGELSQVEAVRTYLDAFPKNFNPSGTSMMEAYRRFFTNPISSTIESAKDYLALGLVKGSVQVEGSKITGLATLERMTLKSAQGIQRGAKAVFQFSGKALPPVIAMGVAASASDPQERHNKFVKTTSMINELANDPEKMIDRLDRATDTMYALAPKTAGAMHQTAARATAFLASKVPQGPERKALSPKYVPSNAELAKFERYYHIVEKPTAAFDQIKSHTLVPESVETLQNVYPKLYGEMKSAIMDEMTSHLAKSEEIPYATRQSLSLFMQEDLDNALGYASISANQIAMAQIGLEQAGQAPMGLGKPSKSGISKLTQSKRLLTDSQATAQREDA